MLSHQEKEKRETAECGADIADILRKTDGTTSTTAAAMTPCPPSVLGKLLEFVEEKGVDTTLHPFVSTYHPSFLILFHIHISRAAVAIFISKPRNRLTKEGKAKCSKISPYKITP